LLEEEAEDDEAGRAVGQREGGDKIGKGVAVGGFLLGMAGFAVLA
jgi:hypothetical protein